ncbi:MAG: YceD family protein [Chitinophaga sp.]
MKFEVGGTITVTCDRCGQPFEMQLWDDFNQVIKLVDNPGEMNTDEDPDVTYISRTESHLNVAGFIYEFINLSIPMQRIHPDNPDGTSGCDPKVLEMLAKMNKPGDDDTNPIWKGLEKFRDN